MGLWRLEFIDYSTEIDAPAEEVFAFFKNLERWSSWTSSVKSASAKSGGAWGAGFKIGFVPEFLPFPLVARIISYEEGRLIEWGIRTSAATLVHRFEFESLGTNRCRVRHHEYATGLLALLTRPMKGKIERFDRKLADDLRAAFKNRPKTASKKEKNRPRRG